MSLGARVNSLENAVGHLSQKIDRIQSLLEEYFGVRHTGVDKQDPVLRTYTLLREFLDKEKSSQQALANLLSYADFHHTAHLMEEFIKNLQPEEQGLVIELKKNYPALIAFVRESALFEELEKARRTIQEQSKPSVDDTSQEVTLSDVIPVSDQDTEMSGVEEKITTNPVKDPKNQDKKKVNKKKKRSASKAPQASVPPERVKAKPSKGKGIWTEQTPLESLLRAAGVRFTPAELAKSEHQLAIAKQLPDRELTEEQRKLIFAKMENYK